MTVKKVSSKYKHLYSADPLYRERIGDDGNDSHNALSDLADDRVWLLSWISFRAEICRRYRPAGQGHTCSLTLQNCLAVAVYFVSSSRPRGTYICSDSLMIICKWSITYLESLNMVSGGNYYVTHRTIPSRFLESKDPAWHPAFPQMRAVRCHSLLCFYRRLKSLTSPC